MQAITLNFDNSSGMEVYLPELEHVNGVDPTDYLLWVAEDGSTYWAVVDSVDGSHDGDSVTQDALYAMRYDSDGLAQGAYDARLYRLGSKTLARSPAIDAGSDDAWGYDSTSTNPKVIDMGQPDIGYHYYRRVADDDNPDTETQEIEISFRQPTRLLGDDQVDGYGYDLYRDGSAFVEQFDYILYSEVISPVMVDPDGLDEKGQYTLDLKTYYWLDEDDDGYREYNPDNPDTNEVYYSTPASIRLIVDWD